MQDQPDTLDLGIDVPTVDVDTLSAGRRLTQRQANAILAGRHPLGLVGKTGLRLHPDAERTAKPADPRTVVEQGIRCGSCVHRLTFSHNSRGYPKCDHPVIGAHSSSAATDVRAWWPGCERWERAT